LSVIHLDLGVLIFLPHRVLSSVTKQRLVTTHKLNSSAKFLHICNGVVFL